MSSATPSFSDRKDGTKTTAWVPSPTGATLHALHYHQVLVSAIQKDMEKMKADKERDILLNGMLQVPVAASKNWSADMANWLHHGVASAAQIKETFERMAAVVDQQDAGEPLYKNMAGHFDTSMAYMAACDLVFKGLEQPSGYTEPLLHGWRQKVKAAAKAMAA